jgi:hypothetical protein
MGYHSDEGGPPEDVMTTKSAFEPDEWAALRDAPHLVSLAVAFSGASGLIGTTKEMFASSAALVQAMKSDDELLRSIVSREEVSAAQASVREVAGKLQAQGGDIAAARQKIAETALEEVRAAVAALAKKSPADAPAYRAFLKNLGERVANAAKEGGFLGIGGERVSEGERKMLASLDAALGAAS